MDETILLRIDSLLKHVDRVMSDTQGLTMEELKRSDLLLRATCFSVAQIGEAMNQMEKVLGERYWNLPWKGARKMRNVIVHDYGNADVEQVYSTIRGDLPSLEIAFRAVRNDLAFGTIETERLVLRKIRIEDALPMFENWTGDPEVAKFVTWPTHPTVEATEAIVKSWIKEEANPKTFRYIITMKDERDEPIGCIDVVDYINGAPEVGYCLSRKHWGKGYMTEACKAFIGYLFDIGFPKVVIEANVSNVASNRVIEKCGFAFVRREEKAHCSPYKPEPIVVNWYEAHR